MARAENGVDKLLRRNDRIDRAEVSRRQDDSAALDYADRHVTCNRRSLIIEHDCAAVPVGLRREISGPGVVDQVEGFGVPITVTDREGAVSRREAVYDGCLVLSRRGRTPNQVRQIDLIVVECCPVKIGYLAHKGRRQGVIKFDGSVGAQEGNGLPGRDRIPKLQRSGVDNVERARAGYGGCNIKTARLQVDRAIVDERIGSGCERTVPRKIIPKGAEFIVECHTRRQDVSDDRPPIID